MLRRLVLVAAACGGLFSPGCGGPEDARPAPRPNHPNHANQRPGLQDPKTPIVRSLDRALDNGVGRGAETEQELKQLLREADAQLRDVLGENPRRLIEQANRKAPVPVFSSAARPTQKSEAP